ncbi:hypothetical protein UFOVP783_121, partial [uncultured Caudovirales phage]
MNPPDHMHTSPLSSYIIPFTNVRAAIFGEDGRITTHAQGLLLGRRICSMIDRGASVSVVLEGVSTFRGPAVQAMLAEVFSTFGVDHANQKLVFTMNPVPDYANQFALQVREAAASFRELEQGMGPQPVVGEAFTPGSGPEILTILPRQPEALAAEERPGNYIDDIQAAREKRLAEDAAKAPRIKVEKSEEPITYEVDLDEK